MRKTLILAAALSLAAAGAVQAHARLVMASPKAGSTSPAPKELKLTYSESIDVAGSSVKVTGPNGAVATGALALDPKNKRVVIVPLAAAAGAGAYKVDWSMKSDDGHTMTGDFGFKVK
jgi:methionine-rich copper-binding protein CopC